MLEAVVELSLPRGVAIITRPLEWCFAALIRLAGVDAFPSA